MFIRSCLGGGMSPLPPQELVPLVSVCVCICMLMAALADEDVNVRLFVCELQGACMCVFLRPPKANTVNSSQLSQRPARQQRRPLFILNRHNREDGEREMHGKEK